MNADAVVGTVSTGGHLSGVAKYLREHRPSTKIVACDVDGSAIFGGMPSAYAINGIGLGWQSKNTYADLFDSAYKISDQKAISTCHVIARESGILMGGSGGLACYGACYYLQNTQANSALVIVPDSGVNYLDQIYDKEWLQSKGIELLNAIDLKESLVEKPASSLQVIFHNKIRSGR